MIKSANDLANTACKYLKALKPNYAQGISMEEECFKRSADGEYEFNQRQFSKYVIYHMCIMELE